MARANISEYKLYIIPLPTKTLLVVCVRVLGQASTNTGRSDRAGQAGTGPCQAGRTRRVVSWC